MGLPGARPAEVTIPTISKSATAGAAASRWQHISFRMRGLAQVVPSSETSTSNDRNPADQSSALGDRFWSAAEEGGSRKAFRFNPSIGPVRCQALLLAVSNRVECR